MIRKSWAHIMSSAAMVLSLHESVHSIAIRQLFVSIDLSGVGHA